MNVLLQELESFNGVVIFATNLAANFDPAFERRIRTHVLFEMPGVDEREQIWRVQMHPTLTPLADDVNFRELAEQYEVSGGDIRNAVLKAALSAAGEPVHDAQKLIHQRHLEEGIQRRDRRQARDEAIAVRGTPINAHACADRTPSPRVVFTAVLVAGVALVVAVIALLVALVRF